jgi:hypothetical protein
MQFSSLACILENSQRADQSGSIFLEASAGETVYSDGMFRGYGYMAVKTNGSTGCTSFLLACILTKKLIALLSEV